MFPNTLWHTSLTHFCYVFINLSKLIHPWWIDIEFNPLELRTGSNNHIRSGHEKFCFQTMNRSNCLQCLTAEQPYKDIILRMVFPHSGGGQHLLPSFCNDWRVPKSIKYQFIQRITSSQAVVFMSALACRTHARDVLVLTTSTILRNEWEAEKLR